MLRRLLITLERWLETSVTVLSSLCTLAMLLEVSTSQASSSSWQLVSGPLSTACKARMRLRETLFGITFWASQLLRAHTIVGSVTWYSSSTSDVNLFQSAFTSSFLSAGTQKTILPSRGMALCILPEFHWARRRSILSCSI